MSKMKKIVALLTIPVLLLTNVSAAASPSSASNPVQTVEIQSELENEAQIPESQTEESTETVPVQTEETQESENELQIPETQSEKGLESEPVTESENDLTDKDKEAETRADLERNRPSSAVNLVSNGGFEETDASSKINAKGWGLWSPGTKDWTSKLDTEIKTEGQQSLYLQSNALGVRVCPSTSVQIEGGKSYMVSMAIKMSDIKPRSESAGVYYRVQIFDSNKKQLAMPQTSLMTGTKDWDQVDIYFDAPAEAVKASIEIFLEYATGEVWFDDVWLYETYSLQIENAPVRMQQGENAQLSTKVIGKDELPVLSWSSSNPDVATVTNGLVEAIAPGTVEIMVAAEEGPKASCTIVVANPDYDVVRGQWLNRLTDNDYGDKSDPAYQQMVNKWEAEAQTQWDAMVKTPDRATLWSDLVLKVNYPGVGKSDSKLSLPFQTAYDRIYSMALAWASTGTSLYHNELLLQDIIGALEWMHANIYNEKYDVTKKIYGNWYHWGIGIPQKLIDILVLVYDELDPVFIDQEYQTLENFAADPFYSWNVWQKKLDHTSANLADTSFIAVMKQVIGEKGEGISQGMSGLAALLPYVTSGDGFYEDGSCIQHKNLAYTSGYGITLLQNIEKILFVLEGSKWDVDVPQLSNVFDWIMNGYRPLTAYGAMMDMTKGRGIARPSTSDMETGRALTPYVLRLAQYASSEQQAVIRSFVKQLVLDGEKYYGTEFYSKMTLRDRAALSNLMKDGSISAEGRPSYFTLFGAMDKAIAHTPEYTLGISMYSSRIGSFEYGNGENLKGFHMSDGALYLYMGDNSQYANEYWPTVDPMRLAGITTDHTAGTIPSNWTVHTSSKDWVGGSYLDSFGSVGMEFEIENSDLNGKKSWFTFEDSVVALGAGINGSKGTETIVENRKLTGSNSLVVNGTTYNDFGSANVPKAEWAWLEGNLGTGNDSTGYYFPEDTSLNLLREERTGSWKDINSNASDELITHPYASLAIPHGTPSAESYSYVILPGSTQGEAKAYAENPAVEILANTSDVQAVYHEEQGITGMNFWNASKVGNVQANTPASVTMQTSKDSVRLGISDPTQTNPKTIIVLHGSGWELLSSDNSIKMESSADQATIEVDTQGSYGKTFYISLKQNVEEPISSNLIRNGGFEQTEENQATSGGVDYGLWKDNIKASEWQFQRYPADAPLANFEASLDTSDKKEGSQSLTFSVNKATGNQQAIFKQSKIMAEPSTTYDFSFWVKMQSVTKDMVVRIEEYNSSDKMMKRSTLSTPGKNTQDWKQYSAELTTRSDTASLLVVIMFNGGVTGTCWLDDVVLRARQVPLMSIAFEEQEVTLFRGDRFEPVVIFSPVNVTNKALIWSSDTPSVVSVQDGVLTALEPGTAQITAVSESNPEIKATMEVTVAPDEFKILGGDQSLGIDNKRYLSFRDSKGDAGKVNWTSSDPDIAAIDADGMLKGVSKGTVTIKLVSEDLLREDSIQVTVTENTTPVEYQLMRKRWLDRILGNESMDIKDPDIAAYVENLSVTAQSLWENLDKSEKRGHLWPQLSTDTTSANYTTQFRNLQKLTLAYATAGTSLYQNRTVYEEIIRGLDYMTIDMKYDGSYNTGNWWDWQIGCGQNFADILMVLKDYLTEDQLTAYTKCISGYAYDPAIQFPNYTSSGANRTDIGMVVMGTAILLEDDSKMELIPQKIPKVFNIVTKGDGFYKDGSFVQHGRVAYTGSYGNELIKGIGRIGNIISGTQWDYNKDDLISVHESVVKGFLPLVYNGRMMSLVSGRSFSRYSPGGVELSSGFGTIANLMVLANQAPEEYAKKYRSACKYWLEGLLAEDFDYATRSRDLETLLNVKQILADDTVQAATPFTGTHIFGSMDRAIQVTEDYAVGIGMYSSRIMNYEIQSKSGLYENMRGWHTGSGVLYLYNTDTNQFGEPYWPTVDSYRLPGTTIDTRQLGIGAGTGKVSPQSWVGGAFDGDNAAVGMAYNASNLGIGMDLKAMKSWFMMDGAIIAMGGNINGTSTASIETIVENRMLQAGGGNPVLINGELFDGVPDNKELKDGSWVHLQGSTDGSDIGYYFPQQTTLHMEKEQRSGTYLDINTLMGNDKEYTADYLKMYVNHGQEVSNGEYLYVLLPGKDAKQTEEYAKNNTLKVLANNSSLQAIEDTSSGLLMLNSWAEEGASVDGFTVDKSASMVIQREGNEVSVTIADPKQKEASLTVSLDNQILEVLDKDDNITVASDNASFTVNTSGALGASFTIRYRVSVPLTGISLDKTELLLEQGEASAQLQVILEPENATVTETVVWESSNTSAATVENGLVTPVGPGETVITAKLGSFEASCVTEVLPPRDKTALDELIKVIEAYAEDDYRSSAWKAMMQEELAKAKAIYEDPDANYNQIQKALQDLLAADAILQENTLDKAALRSIIAIAQKEVTKTEEFTPSSIAAVQEILKRAVAAENDKDALQADIDSLYNELQTAILAMAHQADKGVLQALVNIAKQMDEKLYTSKSWAAIQKALGEAEAALMDKDITESEASKINDLCNALEAAMKDAKLRGNKTALQNIVEKARKISDNSELYQPDTLKDLKKELQNAEAILSDPDAVQEDIDKAIVMLQNALEKVSLKDNGSTDESEKPENETDKPDETTDKPDETTDKPENTTNKPGDTANKPQKDDIVDSGEGPVLLKVILYAGAAVISISLIGILIFQRKRHRF